jgi:hypothetical protein
MPTTIKITAANYNSLQDQISAILTTSLPGSPQTGWGQSSNSDTHEPTAPQTTLITAQQYEDLYIDVVRSRVHQIGADNFTIEDFVTGDYATNTTNTDLVEHVYYTNLQSLITTIETDKFVVHTSQVDEVAYAANQRNTGWNQQLIHEFSLTWSSAEHRRHYFNAGGIIRISSNLTGDTSAKGSDWANALDYGTLNFSYNDSYTSDGANVVFLNQFGNYNISTNNTYTQLFARSPVAYTPNIYTVEVKEVSDSRLDFRITYDDVNNSALTPADANDGFPDVDELVLGTLTSQVEAVKPWGEVTIGTTTYDTVKVNEPTYAVITNLSSGS